MQNLHGRFGVQRAALEPFLSAEAQALTPALVIVHPDDWREYAELLDLSNPFLDTPLIFIWSSGPASDDRVSQAFPERRVVHYYPQLPGQFFEQPLE